MMLLIGAYLGMNNLMTSVFDELGFNALTTLFACLTAGNLFAPSVIARTGARTALLIGAGCHCTINVVAAVAGVASTVRILRSAPLVSIQVVLSGVMELPGDLVVTPLQTREPLNMSVDMLWHRRHSQQGLHRHLRTLIGEIAASLGNTPCSPRAK